MAGDAGQAPYPASQGIPPPFLAGPLVASTDRASPRTVGFAASPGEAVGGCGGLPGFNKWEPGDPATDVGLTIRTPVIGFLWSKYGPLLPIPNNARQRLSNAILA